MTHSAALPFTIVREEEDFTLAEYKSTTETVHGLLRLEGERLVVQWRLARETQRMGVGIQTDREMEPVREVVVPLASVAHAEVRMPWWRWSSPRIVLTAADLRAFEEIAGEAGLKLEHPATLELRVHRKDALAAREFASELELAVAERALRATDEAARLAAGEPEGGR